MENSNNGLTTDSLDSSKVFKKMLQWQLVGTLTVSVIALVIWGLHAGISGLAGGLSVTVGAFFASKIAKRTSKTATKVLINLLKAEAVKFAVFIILLLIIFNFYKQLVPFALIAGVAASALFSGVAMSRLDKTELEI